MTNCRIGPTASPAAGTLACTADRPGFLLLVSRRRLQRAHRMKRHRWRIPVWRRAVMHEVLRVEEVPGPGFDADPQYPGGPVSREVTRRHLPRWRHLVIEAGGDADGVTQIHDVMRVYLHVTVLPADIHQAYPARLPPAGQGQPVVLVDVQAHVAAFGVIERGGLGPRRCHDDIGRPVGAEMNAEDVEPRVQPLTQLTHGRGERGGAVPIRSPEQRDHRLVGALEELGAERSQQDVIARTCRGGAVAGWLPPLAPRPGCVPGRHVLTVREPRGPLRHTAAAQDLEGAEI